MIAGLKRARLDGGKGAHGRADTAHLQTFELAGARQHLPGDPTIWAQRQVRQLFVAVAVYGFSQGVLAVFTAQ
jgi:hypothetical protein